MNKEVFLGVFATRDKNLAGFLPARSNSDLWQVWSADDETYVIQAVDHDRRPQGDPCRIESEDFQNLLAPVSADLLERGEKKGGRPLRSDLPNLLHLWYEQSVAEGRSGESNAVHYAAETALLDELPARAPFSPAAKLSHDETLFFPVRHPDEFLNEQDPPPALNYSVSDFTGYAPGTDVPCSGKAQRLGAAHTPADQAGSAFPSYKSAIRHGLGESNDSVAAMYSGAISKALFESEAETLEKDTRTRFYELSEELADIPQPALERQLTQLLKQNPCFTRQQKYMFSEFGLALRRKRKHDLALVAHKRALSLAPDDENIMFNVARVEYELGNVDNAKKYLESALKKSPEFASAQTFLHFLNGLSATP